MPEVPPSFEAARAICKRHAKSFYFASKFLPRPKRDHAYAVYAFCRLLDDATDEGPEDQRARAIDRFVGILDSVYASDADPLTGVGGIGDDTNDAAAVLPAFAFVARTRAIPKRYFLDLAEGCRMDLSITRYATWPDLERYCYRVAGVVGLIMCRVFDVRDPLAGERAVRMGNAMQLTNILRDVKEDWARGRLYLPLEDLHRFGLTEADVDRGTVDDRFVALMKFEVARARAHYADGATGLGAIPDDGSRFTACAMSTIYAGILRAIERQRYDVYAARAHLTTVQKLLRLPVAWNMARRANGQSPGVSRNSSDLSQDAGR